MTKIPSEGLRPKDEIIRQETTDWLLVRVISKPEGMYLGLDGREARLINNVAIVPGVCVGTSRKQVNEVIEALQRMREYLPE